MARVDLALLEDSSDSLDVDNKGADDMNADMNTLALAAVVRAICEHHPEMTMTIKRELDAVRDLQSKPRAEWVNSDPYGPLLAAIEGR